MAIALHSSRDIIIRTEAFEEATAFYGSVLGLPITLQSDSMMGFDTGAICLYVEKGKQHGPVFDFLVADVQATKHALIAAGCKLVEEDASVPRCYVQDPFGLVFNIGQAPAAASEPESP